MGRRLFLGEGNGKGRKTDDDDKDGEENTRCGMSPREHAMIMPE
jgi:hypothetical protein